MNGAAKEILQKAGFKVTPGRVAIINLLQQQGRPLSQQEIDDYLVHSFQLNEVSIYRALEAFLKAGLVHRVITEDRVYRYAICLCGSSGHCHPHFICRACGRIECLGDQDIPCLPEVEEQYQVEEREYYLRGLCSQCRCIS